MVKKYSLLAGLLFSIFLFFPSHVHADFGLSGATTATASAGVAMPITDLQLTGTGTEPVPVKLFSTNGTLSMSTTTGLTFDGATSGASIYFSGTKTNVNNALATLTYTKATAGTDTLEVSLVSRGEVFFTTNNHLYKFISGDIGGSAARTAATSQTAYGVSGYLATITSQAENDFVAARLQGDGWIGASDESVEGDWRWVTGPESSTLFWRGVDNGSAQGGNYANWSNGEPNDYGAGEDCVQFYISNNKWNDYPCVGSNLPGYVAEFGTSGDLPAIAAKNISINIYNPTLDSLSPTDDATAVGLNSNLTINFLAAVTKGTGNILIKKTSDNSIAETIDVTGSQVTGNGTSNITINPNITFDEVTGYYVTIPNTAFHDGSNHYYAGISTSTAWNFTTVDLTAPTFSNISSSAVASTSATVSWTTNELASSKVSYGLTNAYGTTTSETDTSPRVTSHSRSISSLLACTTYHYKVTSIDSSSNTGNSSDQTFITTGCSANDVPTNTTSNSVTASSGGSTSLTESGNLLTVNAPSNFTASASAVVIQIKAQSGATVLGSLGRPTTVPREVGSIVFDVKAIINSTTILDSFDAPVTISYQYSDADVSGLDESSFWLYHYHNGSWTALDSCTVTLASNTISCTASSFSVFGLFGKAQNSSGSSSSSDPSDTVSAKSCSAPPPGIKVPWLYGAIPESATSIMLYFTHGDDPIDHYAIEYGTKSGQYTFGATNIGGKELRAYTVQSLSPKTTYYFRVRGGNDCAPGGWSNEISVQTGKITSLNHLKMVDSSIDLSDVISEPIAKTENEVAHMPASTSQKNPETSKGYDVNIKIVDGDNKPVKGANVTLHSTPRLAITDEYGTAHFSDVEGGQHQVIVDYNNYSGEQSLNLSGDIKEIHLTVTVIQKKVLLTPFAYGVIGVLTCIILLLLFFLFVAKKKQKKKTKGSLS